MKKLIILAFLAVVLAGCDPVTPAPTPTAQETVGQILARGVVEIAQNGSEKDANEAHPSPTPAPTAAPGEIERVAKVVVWPAVSLLLCAGIVSLALVAALVWHTGERRKAETERHRLAVQVAQTSLTDLKAVMESLREYQQGADVTPRNTGENENGE